MCICFSNMRVCIYTYICIYIYIYIYMECISNYINIYFMKKCLKNVSTLTCSNTHKKTMKNSYVLITLDHQCI